MTLESCGWVHNLCWTLHRLQRMVESQNLGSFLACLKIRYFQPPYAHRRAGEILVTHQDAELHCCHGVDACPSADTRPYCISSACIPAGRGPEGAVKLTVASCIRVGTPQVARS